MHGVSDDFIRVVQRPLPRQQDGGAGHGVCLDVPGSARPVLGHDHNQPGHGEDGALVVLRLALIDGVVLGNDLVDDQFAVERVSTRSGDQRRAAPASGLLRTCCTS